LVIYLRPSTRRRVIVALSVVLVVVGVRIGATFVERPRETAAKISPMTMVRTQEPLASLVIDVTTAGPDQALQCLGVLESISVQATWFATATFVEANPEAISQIAEKGHEFGIKGTDEKPMDKLSSQDVKDRIIRSRQALNKASQEPAPFLLPPGGRTSGVLSQSAFEEGVHEIKPGIDARSMRGKAEDAAKKLVQNIKPGDIVLMSIDKKGMRPAADHLKALVEGLAQQGISLVTLSSLVRSVK
jgi:hypothetical protein